MILRGQRPALGVCLQTNPTSGQNQVPLPNRSPNHAPQRGFLCLAALTVSTGQSSARTPVWAADGRTASAPARCRRVLPRSNGPPRRTSSPSILRRAQTSFWNHLLRTGTKEPSTSTDLREGKTGVQRASMSSSTQLNAPPESWEGTGDDRTASSSRTDGLPASSLPAGTCMINRQRRLGPRPYPLVRVQPAPDTATASRSPSHQPPPTKYPDHPPKIPKPSPTGPRLKGRSSQTPIAGKVLGQPPQPLARGKAGRTWPSPRAPDGQGGKTSPQGGPPGRKTVSVWTNTQYNGQEPRSSPTTDSATNQTGTTVQRPPASSTSSPAPGALSVGQRPRTDAQQPAKKVIVGRKAAKVTWKIDEARTKSEIRIQ